MGTDAGGSSGNRRAVKRMRVGGGRVLPRPRGPGPRVTDLHLSTMYCVDLSIMGMKNDEIRRHEKRVTTSENCVKYTVSATKKAAQSNC